MLPAYYQFYCPVKILSGENALGYIPFEMTLLGVSRAMVVTDRGVAGAGLLSFLEAAFADSDRRIGHVFDEAGRHVATVAQEVLLRDQRERS